MATLDKILREHIDLLNKRQLDELYSYISKDDKSTFTDILYKCGLDPIKYFKDTIPTYFTFGCGHSGEHIPTKIVLPKNITTIDDYAFCHNYTLQKIAMPNVEVIFDGAFQDCENLKSVDFGDKMYKIGRGSFSGCYELTELYLPAAVEIINDLAFEDCIGIRKIHYAGTMEDWSTNRIYSKAFLGCKVSTVHCTDGVTNIYN